jgi:hypothetical protein
MANKTASDIYGYAQDLLKMDGDTIGIPGCEEARTLNWINDLHYQYFQSFYDNNIVLPKNMRGEDGFDAPSSTTLDGDVAVTDTEIDLTSGTNASSGGGGIAIYDGSSVETVWYTGKSTNQLTTVTGIDYAHDDGEIVRFLTALPSNFWKMRPEENMGHGLTVNGGGYKEVPSDPINGEFAVIENGATSYIWLRDTSGKVKISYDKLPTAITSTASILDIPNPHHWYVVWGLVAIFKQILDDEYVPQKEETQMAKILNGAFKKDSAGKVLKVRTPMSGFRRGINYRRLFTQQQSE